MRKLQHSFLLTALALACQAALAQTSFAPTLGEYNWSSTVSQLGMRGVHGAGILGQGVIVAMLDTGINLANPEFLNNGRVLTGFNAVDGSSNVTDSLGHGTHTSGIVGAPGNGSGMYGVAPEALLLPVKVFSGETASNTAINRGIDYAVSRGARVINLSLGAGSPTGETSLRLAAAANNTVIVVAAGNESMSVPNWPGRYARESWANGAIIVAGAVDSSQRLASFSNRAGDTADHYLVAPGVNIISSYNTGYAYLTGTSMSAPAISGAAALVTGYWPYLRANQVAAILLNTADDLGAPGVDAVYGHGMLNVNKALSPIGSYTYRIPNGSTTRVSLSTQGVVSSQPSVATPSAFKGLKTEVFDEYGRNFTSDEGAALAVRSVLTVDSVLGQPNRMLDAAEQVLANGAHLTQWHAHEVRAPSSTPIGMLGMNGAPWNRVSDAEGSVVLMQLTSGTSFSAGDGGLSGMSLGLMGSSLASRLTGTDAVLSNPLMSFSPRHQFATMSMPLSRHWRARVGMLRAPTQVRDAASGDVDVMELSYERGGRALNISAGQLSEQGMLGGYSKPILGLNQATSTMGLTVSGAWALDAHWALTGAFSRTSTGAPSAGGMLLAATGVQSQSYGVGLVRSDTWKDGDRLSVALQAPLRAQNGQLTYSVVNGVTAQGEPIYGTRKVNLASGGQEWLLESRYAIRLSQQATLSAAAVLRVHPDHDASAPSQLALGLRYGLRF